MALLFYPIDFRLLRCSFCGRVQSSENKSCSTEEPVTKFRKNQKVQVSTTFAREGRSLGKRKKIGVIVKAIKPFEFVKNNSYLVSESAGEFIISFPRIMTHEWKYEIEFDDGNEYRQESEIESIE